MLLLHLTLSLPHLPQSWSHLIGQRSCHDHDIRLPGTGSEHHSKSVHVVTRRRHVHHLHSATCQAEGHGPHRALRRWQSSEKAIKNTQTAKTFTQTQSFLLRLGSKEDSNLHLTDLTSVHKIQRSILYICLSLWILVSLMLPLLSSAPTEKISILE